SLGGIDAVAFQLGARRRLPRAPVHASARDEIERGDALGHPRRLVVAGRHQHDAVTQANALRALGRGGQEHFGRRGVRILLEKVVLDLPRVVDAEAVGQLDLAQCILEQLKLRALAPGPRQLMLVEDPELHAGCCRRASNSAATCSSLASSPSASVSAYDITPM